MTVYEAYFYIACAFCVTALVIYYIPPRRRKIHSQEYEHLKEINNYNSKAIFNLKNAVGEISKQITKEGSHIVCSVKESLALFAHGLEKEHNITEANFLELKNGQHRHSEQIAGMFEEIYRHKKTIPKKKRKKR
jgi:hypothetical protein